MLDRLPGSRSVNKVLGSLKATGLIDQRGTRRGDNPPLRITRAGLEAIGIAPENEGDSQRESRRHSYESYVEQPIPMCICI
jgi:hypothetical protein